MIKVKDVDGKEVRGLYRDSNGSLVMNDEQLLQKYLAEKSMREKNQEKIKTLESEVSDLKSLVQQLLQKLN